MLNLQDFLRATPPDLLQAYFASAGVTVPPSVNWDAEAATRSKTLLDMVDALDDRPSQRVVDDADRICAMAREDGQEALFDVTTDPRKLEVMENGHARAVWMFVHDPRGWEHAEQVRYADDRRFGRMWDGFTGPKRCKIAREGEPLEAFRRAISSALGSRNVEIEICDRMRAVDGGKKVPLVQVAIFVEGRKGDRRAFVDGRLSRVPDRPVIEAAVTYEPRSGAIEVVAKTREFRGTLVQFFALYILGSLIEGQRLPVRHYSLDHLRRPFAFPTEAGDGIESVAVTMIRLMPLDTQAERVTLECMREASRSIWSMAAERFGDSNPLLEGHRITQVRLRIRFAARAGGRGSRSLPVTITTPHGCDLKGRSARERMIGEKYLELWRLRRDV